MRTHSIQLRAALALALAAASLGLAACSQQASGSNRQSAGPVAQTSAPDIAVEPAATVPSATSEPPVAAAPAPKPAPKPTAKQIVDRKCTICHSASKALTYRTSSKSSAARMVSDMMNRGASLSAAEKAILIEYYLR